MDSKEKLKQLKLDIPAVYIALKKKETPIIAKIFAFITVANVCSNNIEIHTKRHISSM